MPGDPRPPIIIIGMHRSGTSMLAGLLAEAGLFIGRKRGLKGTNEADFFNKINRWLMDQCGAFWQGPEALHYLFEDQEVRACIEDYLRFYLTTRRAVAFMGWSRFLMYSTPANFDFPWGWKDPRNTLTLPVWLNVFPNAKVINITRHGVDVANSIVTRSAKRKAPRLEELEKHSRVKYRTAYHRWFEPRLLGFASTLEQSSLEAGFVLWEKYLGAARRHVAALGDRALDITYEDFATDPLGVITKAVKFCGLKCNEDVLGRLADKFRRSRVFAYQKNEELIGFAESMSDRLKTFGY